MNGRCNSLADSLRLAARAGDQSRSVPPSGTKFDLGSDRDEEAGEILRALESAATPELAQAASAFAAADPADSDKLIDTLDALLNADVPDMRGGRFRRWSLRSAFPPGCDALRDVLKLLDAAAGQVHALHVHAERGSRSSGEHANRISATIRELRDRLLRVGEAVMAGLQGARPDPATLFATPPSSGAGGKAEWNPESEAQIKSRAVQLSKKTTSVWQLAKQMALEFDASASAIRSWLMRRDPARKVKQASPEFWEVLMSNFKVVRANKKKKPNQ